MTSDTYFILVLDQKLSKLLIRFSDKTKASQTPKVSVPGGLVRRGRFAFRCAFPLTKRRFSGKIDDTRIHEKQDNRLVFIAPTARWILMRRTDAQSAAVPMKISYLNAYGTKPETLKAKAFKVHRICSSARFWTKLSKNLAPSTGVLRRSRGNTHCNNG